MKIDGNRLTQDIEATRAAEATQKLAEARGARKSDRPGAAAADTVEVSADAKLVATALKAAAEPTPVRTELVEAMKRKLANGEVGNDAGRLADRVIDYLLEE
jgi:flagellar biosynthesis anti-sigma factor FlgM